MFILSTYCRNIFEEIHKTQKLRDRPKFQKSENPRRVFWKIVESIYAQENEYQYSGQTVCSNGHDVINEMSFRQYERTTAC